MRLIAKSSAFGWLLACWLSGAVCVADPLHPFGQEGAWRHEFSGWQFPKQVGNVTRVQAPYTIDGNNDVGAQYAGPKIAAVVEVYLADSAASDAKLDGAKASAAHKAGESARVRAERAFHIDASKPIRGTKVTYRVKAGAQTSLYFFEAERFTVKVLGSSDADDDKALDDFVRGLPWNTLGDPTALH